MCMHSHSFTVCTCTPIPSLPVHARPLFFLSFPQWILNRSVGGFYGEDANQLATYMLGNPVGVLRALRSGLSDFITQPIAGATTGGASFSS